ncbi:MAG: hypothetical protein JWM38_2589 [Sphingomonas bacterium]|nr:hypothetical protein [Sphingomonas bacterium]MDB5719162.1 hypothetical protein [Sphingomonas bacterium]
MSAAMPAATCSAVAADRRSVPPGAAFGRGRAERIVNLIEAE